MSLFSLVEFERFTRSFAGVTLVDQWESKVAKVGGKVFALLGRNEDGERIIFKCSEETFEILTSLNAVTQAPYFAKRQWISVGESATLTDHELRDYVKRSYAMVASGLSRKIRQELGIV